MIGRLFEHAGPLVAALEAAGPFPSIAALLARARTMLRAMPETDRVTVVNCHPRIGERAEVVRAQSTLSYREQGYGAGDATPPAVLEELARLNAAYEGRFGFRFVAFVNRRAKADLIPVLRARLSGGTREGELATALEEILAIARDRARSEG